MSYEIDGVVKQLGEVQSFGEKGFTKQEVVVTTADEKYPQDVALEFTKDNIAKLEGLTVGDRVGIAFNIL